MVLPVLSDPQIPIVILYVGPEQIMPLASYLGAAVGIALMFWNRLVDLVRRSWVFVTRRQGSDPEQSRTSP
jgi:hypothetical protein